MRNCATRGGRCRSRPVSREVGQPARQRTGSGPDQRRRERAQKRHRQKRELEAGFEELVGVEHQEAQRDRRQQIEARRSR